MDWIGLYAQKGLVTAPLDSTARDIAAMMEKCHIGSVVITENNEILGIVTERDICRYIVGRGKDANSPVSELVLKNVPRLPLEGTIQDAVDTMQKTGFRYLFVTDNTSRIIGVVSLQDLIRALKEQVENEAAALRDYIGGNR